MLNEILGCLGAHQQREPQNGRGEHVFAHAAVFRLIPTEIASLEDLNIPTVVKEFGHMRSGLVLVTGPTGSGKSTTLAALLDYINLNFSRHIITVEEPIEFVHRNKKSIITQREVPIQTPTFADGLRAALREDADIVLVGEMRDLETIRLAMTAAETGHLVLGTLHTTSAPKTIDRIIDVFPGVDENTNEVDKETGDRHELVRWGIIRGRFRDSFSEPKPFEPGKPTQVSFDLYDLLHDFKRGHRLQIQIQMRQF